ncbi:hypothetical protein BVI2075_320196 [Burkholderia vietnamiensis]|nr:hypothetical protein BVI2075_320196 [Burkholderia vietnamiensis]
MTESAIKANAKINNQLSEFNRFILEFSR